MKISRYRHNQCTRKNKKRDYRKTSSINNLILILGSYDCNPGAIIATLGCVFPSCVIVLLLSYIYYRYRGLSVIQGILSGLRPAVVAMIASAGISLFIMTLYGERHLPADLTTANIPAFFIFLAAFIVMRKFKPGPIKVMMLSGLACVIVYSII